MVRTVVGQGTNNHHHHQPGSSNGSVPTTLLRPAGDSTMKESPPNNKPARKDARVVVVGGGVSAGYFVQELVRESAALVARPSADEAEGVSSSSSSSSVRPPKALCVIVSAEPAGMAPYDRTLLSKEGLKELGEHRAFHYLRGDDGDGGGREVGPEWYAAHCDVLYGSVMVDVNVAYRRVLVCELATGKTTEVTYEKLVLATGCRPTRLQENTSFEASLWAENHADLEEVAYEEAEAPATMMLVAPSSSSITGTLLNQGGAPAPAPACPPGEAGGSHHPDWVRPARLAAPPDAYGFGSVHYLRDVGDAVKLAAAVSANEVDGQETNTDPIVIVGGGKLSVELAATIARFHDVERRIPVTVVLGRDRIVPALFDPKKDAPGARTRKGPFAGTASSSSDQPAVAAADGAKSMGLAAAEADECDSTKLSEFYERQLIKLGVKFVREHRVRRLWRLDEEGDFCTFAGPAHAMQRTRPRRFGPAEPYLKECRGVVLESKAVHEEARREVSYLPARFVILALGVTPNAEAVARHVALAEGGTVAVDGQCRTSQADIYAIGDVATFPLPLTQEAAVCLRTAEMAMAMAQFCARTVTLQLTARRPAADYDPVPVARSRFADLSYEFHGRNLGTVVVLGLEDFAQTRVFGAFWVHDPSQHQHNSKKTPPAAHRRHVVVGAFIEGGTSVQKAACARVAREQPEITRVERLRRLPLDAFLADPHCLTPPTLKPGDFLAELDPASVDDAFARYDLARDFTCKTAHVADLMRDLGADWDAEEQYEALHALDPDGTNVVHLDTFKRWWIGDQRIF